MIDLTPIVQPILAVIGAVITSLLAIYIPKALAAFQVRTGIILTDQQRATVTGAIHTAAGVLETDLDKGALHVSHINVDNPAVVEQAQAAIAAVPKAAAALGVTVDGAARMIIGAMDTTPRVVIDPPASVIVKAP